MDRCPVLARFVLAALALIASSFLGSQNADATGCPPGSATLSCTAYWASGTLHVNFTSPSVGVVVRAYWEPGDIDALGGATIRLAPNTGVTVHMGAPPAGAIAYKIELVDEDTSVVLYCLHAPIPPPSFTADAASKGSPRIRARIFEGHTFSRAAVSGVKGAARFNPESVDRTMSGTLLKKNAATTSWLLYPDACTDVESGTWGARTSPVGDSLNTYPTGSIGPYQRLDRSLNEILWNVVSTATPVSQRPAILSGTRSLWCGKYDARWPVSVGYPNSLSGYQVLYLDTGSHAGDYTLNLTYNLSGELGYDHMYLIGGGNGSQDPIGSNRAILDELITTGFSGLSELLVAWTGSIQSATPGASIINTLGGSVQVTGSASGFSSAVTASINIAADHRALYFVFRSDSEGSAEDGLWPHGAGQVLDAISTSDNGSIYGDQIPAGGIDVFGGVVLVGSQASPIVSARVSPGIGELWQIVEGAVVVTPDACAPQKSALSDRMFFGADASTYQTIPAQANAIVTCAVPVPGGTGSLVASWTEYVHSPPGAGFVRVVEYQYFKDGVWSQWANVFENGGGGIGAPLTWTSMSAELAGAAQADLVRLRFTQTCMPALAADGVNCAPVQYGVLWDNLTLTAVSGVPTPMVDIFPGSLAQSTFVDGTMLGLNCFTPPCWPGIRGSDLSSTPDAPAAAIHDNFNSPLGDSITVAIVSGLRRNGMGVNWRFGYDKSVNGGTTIAHTNASYNPALDTPRMIYRLFDPATKAWSPLDSTALDADAVQISAAGDTIVLGNAFRIDWPPRDKAGLNLPGGFTINGQSAYSDLSFLPRGCRIRYTFKGVDLNGGTSYATVPMWEIEELEPITPGQPLGWGWLWCVLPGAYSPGSAGSLLAGRTDTPILNLDGAYKAWSYGWDPVSDALRGMGVRADRYRLLQGIGMGANIGGHEVTGAPDNQRPRSLSNYFPNMEEYGIRDSLAAWYRIIIQSSHGRNGALEDEQDARLLEEWWNAPTGTNGGDRCLFVSGDDYFSALLNSPSADPDPRRTSYAQNVLGVASAFGAWNGTTSNSYPTVEDRFASPAAGPGLAAGYTYPVDGGCPRANRFDALTKTGSAESQASAFYPLHGGIVDVAAVAVSTEHDPVADNDRSKSVGYGFSIQYPRKVGIPVSASNYARSGVQERLQIVYKFLASCRAARGPSTTSQCWPCPTDANPFGNWAVISGFQTGSYGPLYPIQDPLAATGVHEPDIEIAPAVNALLQNRPNPFNPQTTIPYSLAAAGPVEIRVFDVSGRVVRTLVSGVKPAGFHSVRWNGETDTGGRVASGMYFYRILYPDGSVSAKKLTMLR